MLVLSRKRNEAIQIGEGIEVKVLGIEGDQVKIGISAPSSVDIYRKEIYLDIMHENNQAANIPNELVNLLKKT